MNIAQELSIVRDNIAEYGMTNITQLEYDAIYQQGRADATKELPTSLYCDGFNDGYSKCKADVINAIKNDLHERLTEEMDNPYQDQSLCQGLYYAIQRCDWFLSDDKEQNNDSSNLDNSNS